MAFQNQGILKISFEENFEYDKPERIYPFANSKILNAKLVGAVLLTQGEDVREVYEISLDIDDAEYDFQPGDTIGILPCNNAAEVDEIFDCLQCNGIVDEKCSIIAENEKKRKAFAHIPTNCTLRNIFLKYVDIRTPPKKGFLKSLAQYCKDEDEITLIETISERSSSDYMEFISTKGSTLLGLLKSFPSCKPPLDLILENLTPLQPRPYSISSSPLLKRMLKITFSVVHVTESLKGVCTSFLQTIAKTFISRSDNIEIGYYFRKPNLFRLPKELSRPIIMIGPGTGVAPFIGFLRHLTFSNQNADTWLFFGCRYQDRDFIYRGVMESSLNEDCLKKLSVAFSREQEDKIYVTHLMRTESKQLCEKLTRQNAMVYVCGDAKNIVKDVKETLLLCLEENGKTKEDAEEFLHSMVQDNRYIEDKWV